MTILATSGVGLAVVMAAAACGASPQAQTAQGAREAGGASAARPDSAMFVGSYAALRDERTNRGCGDAGYMWTRDQIAFALHLDPSGNASSCYARRRLEGAQAVEHAAATEATSEVQAGYRGTWRVDNDEIVVRLTASSDPCAAKGRALAPDIELSCRLVDPTAHPLLPGAGLACETSTAIDSRLDTTTEGLPLIVASELVLGRAPGFEVTISHDGRASREAKPLLRSVEIPLTGPLTTLGAAGAAGLAAQQTAYGTLTGSRSSGSGSR